MLAIGLMSGTSLDGVDAVLVDIMEESGRLKIRYLDAYSSPYDEKTREMVRALLPHVQGNVEQLAYTHYYLGEKYGEVALSLIKKTGLKPKDVGLIACSGQTVCNLSKGTSAFKRTRLQIGEISVIAEMTRISTVGDFRPREVAAGGEGAPLVTFFDYHVFQDPRINRVVLNIGGIANVTYVPAGAELSDVLAFDVGPGNMLIDGAVKYLTCGQSSYDEDGEIAAKGRIEGDLLKELMEHPFIRSPPPKSAGREEFGEHFLQHILQQAKNRNISRQDLVCTLTAFTAEAIAENCKRYLGKIDEMVVGGGGAYNKTLMAMVGQLLQGTRISRTEDYGIPIKAKEAMAFALLGYCALRKIPSNVPSATGARRPVILGKIVWGD